MIDGAINMGMMEDKVVIVTGGGRGTGKRGNDSRFRCVRVRTGAHGSHRGFGSAVRTVA